MRRGSQLNSSLATTGLGKARGCTATFQQDSSRVSESTTRSSYTKTYTHYLSALLSRSLHFIRILEASLYCYACITSAVHAMFPPALANIRLTNAARILAQTSVQDNNEQGSTIEGQNDQHKIKPTQKGRRVTIENVNEFFE